MIVAGGDQRVALEGHGTGAVGAASCVADAVLRAGGASGRRRRGQAFEQLALGADIDGKRQRDGDRFEGAFTLHALASRFIPVNAQGLAVEALRSGLRAAGKGHPGNGNERLQAH
ncbi:hypothetical protein [Bradyrhizobium cosmicum]|uniref:hypothetical protein n=1 Tax=Bradyrhizobium cosmicum TaxID=1404864 RepID=UPI0011632387|nr:hypothetical protein [Bradyrhizobium cosmicum]QDP26325.1 hypothetical protein FNV92_31035 [Bradyrhizobium cosmicum]